MLLVLVCANSASAASPRTGTAPSLRGAPPAGPFSVSISSYPVLTEPGLPVGFSADPSGGVPPFLFVWTSSSNLSGGGQNFSAWANAPGNLTVTVIVYDSGGGLAAASYVEPVLPGVAVRVGAENTTDTEAPFSLALNVSGGVPPYQANVSVDGGPALEQTLPLAGVFPIAAWSSWTGPINVSASVTDALGATARTSSIGAALAPRPEVVWAGGPTAVEVGVPYTWWASVVGGTAPVNWSVTCAGAVSNITGPTTTTSSPGTVGWSARFNDTGNASLEFIAVDAGRSVASLEVPVHVASPVRGFLSVPIGGSSDAVNVTVEGGVPPYVVMLSTTEGSSWVGNVSVEGTFTWTLDATAATGENVTLRVLDAAGGNSTSTLALRGAVPVDPAAPSAASDSLGTLGLTLVAVGGIGGALADRLLRRRVRPASPAEPRVVPATEEVERLLGESDSIERETVYAAGEERGFSRESMDAGIAHWLRLGRIDIVRRDGGEELLHWRDETETPPAGRP
jgi:hypothetical protein